MKGKNIKDDVVLFPHQEDATKRVLKDSSAILAHDTGTGKTLTFINSFEALKDSGKAKKALVVLPAALRSNFVDGGLKRFTKKPSYTILGTKQESDSPDKNITSIDKYDRNTDYNVVSYDLFKRDPKKYIDKVKPDTIIYDEIHRAKNEDTKVTKVLKDVRGSYKNFIAGTGSVVSNTPADVVPLIDIMTDGKHRLGNKITFERRFLHEDKEGIKRVNNKSVVQNQLKKYVHYVGKDDLKNYSPPKVVESITPVIMSEYQDEVYRLIYDKLDPVTKVKLKAGVGRLSYKEFKGMFNKLMAARQASNSPHALEFSNVSNVAEGYKESPKAQKLIKDVVEHLKNTQDGKVILGTQFINGGVDVLEHGLKENKIPYSKFIGKGNKGVSAKSRQQSVKDFKEGKSKALIISSAGGEGLDFPDTTMVSMLDGHFNPEVIQQMIARGVRAGGQKHRNPEDRKVEVKYYQSKPRFSKTEAAKNLLESIDPMTYFNRFLDNKPLFTNPFKTMEGTDKIIAEIAKQKSLANKDIKSLLKTSAFKERYFDINKHMRDYNKTYGERISDDSNDEFGYYDKLDELQRVENLKKDIAAALKRSNKAFGYSKVNKRDREKMFNDEGVETTSHYIKNKILPLSAFGAVGVGLRLLAKSEVLRTTKPKEAILPALAMILGPAALGGVAGAFLSKDQISGDMAKVKLQRLRKLKDEDLIRVLRGDVVKQEKIKTEDFYL